MKIVSLLWKIYFVILTLIYIAGYVFALMAKPGLFQYIDIVPSLLGLLGLFGYAFHKAILKPMVWKVVFVLVLVWNLYYNGYLGWLDIVTINGLSITLFVLAFLILVPNFLALFLYGFKSADIWGHGAPKQVVEDL